MVLASIGCIYKQSADDVGRRVVGPDKTHIYAGIVSVADSEVGYSCSFTKYAHPCLPIPYLGRVW